MDQGLPSPVVFWLGLFHARIKPFSEVLSSGTITALGVLQIKAVVLPMPPASGSAARPVDATQKDYA